MNSQSVDLPTTSTVGGLLIATEEYVMNLLYMYIGFVIVFFVICLGIVYIIRNRDMCNLKRKYCMLYHLIKKKQPTKQARFANN